MAQKHKRLLANITALYLSSWNIKAKAITIKILSIYLNFYITCFELSLYTFGIMKSKSNNNKSQVAFQSRCMEHIAISM